jgi:hypothetical protein
MFLGHFGLGFGAKRVAPQPSLGALFAAAELADLLWPSLLLLGIERVAVAPGATVMTPLDFERYPYSHSLVALILWGAIFGAVYAIVRRSRTLAAMTLALLVVSHWFLDLLMHRPDLPLTLTGSARYGLGLWNSRTASLVLELVFFGVGVWIYLRTTAPRDRIGSAGLWGLIGFLLLIYLASAFGPPPPTAGAVPWAAQGMWLIVAWGYWVDRHRTVHTSRP